MRLSKTAWLILGVGVFIIAFATLYTIYSGQSGEQGRLNSSLATAQVLLPKLIAEREDLEVELTQGEEKLAEATLSLSRSEARFPRSVESIEYDERLFRIAYDCDLQVVELTASEPRTKKIEEITYTVTTFEVVVRSKRSVPKTAAGFEPYINETVANILDFIDTVATSESFTNATIELASMVDLEPPEEVSGGEAGPEATIQLIIYGFPR